MISPYVMPAFKESKKSIDLEVILNEVVKYFDTNAENIFCINNSRKFIIPRHIAYYFSTELIKCTGNEFGVFFHRDRTTVIAGHTKVKNFLSIKDEDTMRYVNEINEKLHNKLFSKKK